MATDNSEMDGCLGERRGAGRTGSSSERRPRRKDPEAKAKAAGIADTPRFFLVGRRRTFSHPIPTLRNG